MFDNSVARDYYIFMLNSFKRNISILTASAVIAAAVLFAFCPSMGFKMQAAPSLHGDCASVLSISDGMKSFPGCTGSHYSILASISSAIFDSLIIVLAVAFLAFAFYEIFKKQLSINKLFFYYYVKKYLINFEPFVHRILSRWFIILEHESVAAAII